MLEDVWEQFFKCIIKDKQINHFSTKQVCGVYFLYIQSECQQTEESIKKLLIECSKTITEQFKLIYRIEFIRNENNHFVFKHRFYVPNKKMFCCGNNCANCTRFRK
ncbi:hypothetical protein [Bacillus sp. AFS055030]|uniref:hypothetical protein n=1 Tax=Bacillus sp. AFS055030 TaxID=2033507 RepID=UPI000BFD4481|nr:hypothetical protein [Bacillus sp. AFS055030]PGL69780.1 hypothetical protein CN925_14965 [Bacillus sp. AFS055030]